MKQKSSIPQHIGIIMDGNRRWARQHKLQALQGHEYVANKVIQPLVERGIAAGVDFMTFWAFSTENWQRDQAEVMGLMNIFRQAFSKSAQELHEKGVRLKVIGDMSQFPADIQENVKKWVETSKNNTRITVIFALNYGGRNELIRAVNSIITQANFTGKVTESQISNALDTAGIPDADLIIRPGGEQRLSGFMLWQSEYSELYFSDVLMPDFTPVELDKALADYEQRHRRFGK